MLSESVPDANQTRSAQRGPDRAAQLSFLLRLTCDFHGRRPFCLLSGPESVTLSGQNDLRHDVLVQAEDVVGIVRSFQPHESFVFGITVDGSHDALAGLDHVVHIVAARGEGF